MAAGRQDLLLLSFFCEADIPKGRAVKFGANGGVVLAVADTDAIIGLSNPLVDYNLGDNGDFWLLGVSFGQLGTGGATVGAKLTADATGKLVVAAAGNRTVGIALEDGVLNDLIPVLIIPN
jgi:hypothetical protein